MTVRDPVDDIEIPLEWLRRACKDMTIDELAKMVESGRVVVTSRGEILKRGYSTGTVASACAKASVLSLNGSEVKEVDVWTPCGVRAHLKVWAKNG